MESLPYYLKNAPASAIIAPDNLDAQLNFCSNSIIAIAAQPIKIAHNTQ